MPQNEQTKKDKSYLLQLALASFNESRKRTVVVHKGSLYNVHYGRYIYTYISALHIEKHNSVSEEY